MNYHLHHRVCRFGGCSDTATLRTYWGQWLCRPHFAAVAKDHEQNSWPPTPVDPEFEAAVQLLIVAFDAEVIE